MKKKQIKSPRNLSIVKFDFEGLPKKYHSQYPFIPEKTYVFLGEIANMPGHCAIIKDDGTITVGWHSEDFIEVPEKDV